MQACATTSIILAFMTTVAMRFLLLLLVGTQLRMSALAHQQPGVYHADRQIEWLREHGGFFSEKIQFQRLNTSNTDSPIGIFAVEDIGEEETIMVIPHECLLTSEGSYDMCNTTRNLVKQRKLGNASKFAPYVDYVFDEKHKGQMPSSWSMEGQVLLQTIVGKWLPPAGITYMSFEYDCGGSGDPLEEEAYLTVERRAWEDIAVPVYDMINHRNGKWFNTDSTSVHRGDDITVFTTREVQAGEQLYLSYNECTDCHYGHNFVLPDILRSHGFVEQYPRRWRFTVGDNEDIFFELDQDDDTKEISFTWLSKKPSMNGYGFLQGQFRRLHNLYDYVFLHARQLKSNYEREVSIEYYEALMTALEYVLNESPDYN